MLSCNSSNLSTDSFVHMKVNFDKSVHYVHIIKIFVSSLEFYLILFSVNFLNTILSN